MNLKVNQDKCIGCGQCVSICEDVFNFNDDGLAEVIETPIKASHSTRSIVSWPKNAKFVYEACSVPKTEAVLQAL